MKQNNKVYLTLAIIVMLVILTIFLYNTPDDNKGITAMDGKLIADDIANNWSLNATLIGVRKSGSANNQNQFQSWFYVYLDTSNISRPHKCIEIQISAAENINKTFENWSGLNIPIENWSIDSDNAYEIAINNDKIKSFLNHNPMIDSFSLSSGSGQAVWVIEWVDWGFIDDPRWARIEIDANNGEVQYVDVDN